MCVVDCGRNAGGGGRVPGQQRTPTDAVSGAQSYGAVELLAPSRTARCSAQDRSSAAARGDPTRAPGRRRVLLLNATFEPLTAVPLRRAVVLIVCGKAELVHGDASGAVLHSAGCAVPAPSVIRLRQYVRVPYRGRVPLSRAALLLRDDHRCVYCGAKAETIDHVVPRSRGGPHSWENCVASCRRCNHRKADRMLRELGWRLPAAPRAPHGRHWRLLGSDTDPLWLPYLGAAAA